MGLMRLFGKGPLSTKKIDKIAKLAANPFAQPDVRMQQLQRLLDDGSDLALRGMLRRLAANAQGHIADEDEKKWLEDALVGCGDRALEPLADYIRSETKLTYALRAYRRVAGEAPATEFFLQTLERYGPDDYRAGEAKLQLVLQLSEGPVSPPVLLRLAAFLHDHSDDVAWAVMETVERTAQGGTIDAAHDGLAMALQALVCDPDISQRVARRAADLWVALGWTVPPGPDSLAPGLEEGFFLDKKRFVRRRGNQLSTA